MTENNKSFFKIPYYHEYISPALAEYLLSLCESTGVPDLIQLGSSRGLENKRSLEFLVSVYSGVEDDLAQVINQRLIDRKFLDIRVRATSEFNDKWGRDVLHEDYKTVLGLEDVKGRIVFGPLNDKYAESNGKKIAPVPEFLKGHHVTLFGPPDSAKMAINAMNAFHRKIKDEPIIIEKLLSNSKEIPKWGADNEDSKTPLRSDLVDAGVHLTECFEGTLEFNDKNNGKTYQLENDRQALPIKRFPGLAMPSSFLFYKNNPIPLHVYDFTLHLYKNWNNPKALVFYVPKLENEEEARYLHKLISLSEKLIQAEHPEYKLGTVRIMIVLENPRAILRTNEIMDELYPYFVGASLGWHDYLGSTARLLKEDHHYRIPVKADPDIVIKYIKASHLMLADVVGPRGGIKVGGMYGILPIGNDRYSDSFQITLLGFFKDVIVQLKRDLNGFWVAHPDFVRIGMSIVEAWKLYQDGDKSPMKELVSGLFNKKYQTEILKYIAVKDIKGLNKKSDSYVRSLIVADIKESDFIANNHPDEIRYNVFQSLQYLTDWLAGNGCVALPASVRGVPVRVMDDLATAERSRWEVWHELYHGRFSMDEFLKIAFEEMHFIRKNLSNAKKIVQVEWNEITEKWYPIALKIMIHLMTDKKPPEFATELLMPFTVPEIRQAKDPWAAIQKIDAEKYTLNDYVGRFYNYFEACGHVHFARTMALGPLADERKIKSIINEFDMKDVNEAAYFHGDIGESKNTLDKNARLEQAAASTNRGRDKSSSEKTDSVKNELRELGQAYKKKFGFKFLVSAFGLNADELLQILKKRITNSKSVEMVAAKEALAKIAISRLKRSEEEINANGSNLEMPFNTYAMIDQLRESLKIHSLSVAVNSSQGISTHVWGQAKENTWFEIASLSKTLASALSLELLKKKNIDIDSCVNFPVSGPKEWSEKLTYRQLMNHTALNKHYVDGFRWDKKVPSTATLLKEIEIINPPGEKFKYSGGGFILLEHLVEKLSKLNVEELGDQYFKTLKISELTFRHKGVKNADMAEGYISAHEKVPSGRLQFPVFAAGAYGTARGVAEFLQKLTEAYHNLDGVPGISHDTAVEMLSGSDKGSLEFMGVLMGLGVFIAEAGPNKFMIHQGANDGFRALYLQCFSGPNRDQGFTIFCNADNEGVVLISKVAQVLLKILNFKGVDFSKYQNFFSSKKDLKDIKNNSVFKTKQEEIVNRGYKEYIFSAFERTSAEYIFNKGPLDPLYEYNMAVDSKILQVSNDRFARAENLFSPYSPAFDVELYGEQGKIMDSWETSRHNPMPFEFLEFQMLEKFQDKKIQYVSFSTQFHDGNHFEKARLMFRKNSSEEWQEILPWQHLQGHSFLTLKLKTPFQIGKNQFRVEAWPDGGLSRLGLYDELPNDAQLLFRPIDQARAIRFPVPIPKPMKPLSIPYEPKKTEISKNIMRASKLFKTKKSKSTDGLDYASRALGGKLLKASNEHYGPAVQVISPFLPLNMFDGLESARSRVPDHFEEASIQLGKNINIQSIVFNFKFYVNNNPKEISIDVWHKNKWQTVVEKCAVKKFASLQKKWDLNLKFKTNKIRVRTYPDGGVHRIHVYGK